MTWKIEEWNNERILKRMKIIKIEKVEKFVANLHDKNEYVIHITNLKQTLNHRLVF